MTEACDARCCDLHEVPLLESDIGRLTAATGWPRERFVEASDGWILLRGAGVDDAGCVFIGTVHPDGRPLRGCTVHGARPAACRTYPFVLKRGGARPRIERDDACPHARAFPVPDDAARALADLWRNLEEERRGRGAP